MKRWRWVLAIKVWGGTLEHQVKASLDQDRVDK